MYPKILPEVRGGAQRAEGSVVEGKLLYYCLKFYVKMTDATTAPPICRP